MAGHISGERLRVDKPRGRRPLGVIVELRPIPPHEDAIARAGPRLDLAGHRGDLGPEPVELPGCDPDPAENREHGNGQNQRSQRHRLQPAAPLPGLPSAEPPRDGPAANQTSGGRIGMK